jgi:hypothetical protein
LWKVWCKKWKNRNLFAGFGKHRQIRNNLSRFPPKNGDFGRKCGEFGGKSGKSGTILQYLELAGKSGMNDLPFLLKLYGFVRKCGQLGGYWGRFSLSLRELE